jgi:hypothetical protein
VNEERVRKLLALYTLEECLELMDVTAEETLLLLLENGYEPPEVEPV